MTGEARPLAETVFFEETVECARMDPRPMPPIVDELLQRQMAAVDSIKRRIVAAYGAATLHEFELTASVVSAPEADPVRIVYKARRVRFGPPRVV